MRTRLKSCCQSTTSGRGGAGGRCKGCLASVYLCRCCCGPDSGDKDCRGRPLNSHLEKCQSFYQGLSQTGTNSGPGGLSASLSGGHGGPYHPTGFAAKKSRTLGGPNGQLTSGLIGSANTTSRVIIFRSPKFFLSQWAWNFLKFDYDYGFYDLRFEYDAMVSFSKLVFHLKLKISLLLSLFFWKILKILNKNWFCNRNLNMTKDLEWKIASKP